MVPAATMMFDRRCHRSGPLKRPRIRRDVRLDWLRPGRSPLHLDDLGVLATRACKATSTPISAPAAAITGTLMPFLFPLLTSGTVTTGRELVADVLLVTGGAWSVWSLRSLGRNLSVIAQAREVAEHGPYRWIRHPLYTGESCG